jgi:hypothetical protein
MTLPKIVHQQSNFNNLVHFPECSCTEKITHPSHAKPGIHPFPDKLYVVTCLFNPLRYRNRYFNYWAFENMVESGGAILYTVEIAFGDRHFEITDPENPRHLQLRADDHQEIWLKENSLNLLISRLPKEANYIAWLDADISFTRPEWAQETLHLLQHYDFLQMFSHAQDIGVNYEPLRVTPGFVYARFTDPEFQEIIKNVNGDNGNLNYYYGVMKKEIEQRMVWKFYHSGFCWAARRTALDKVGGLIDWGILGSSDWLMCHGLFGLMDKAINVNYTESYKKLCKIWEDRALKHVRMNVGYMPGLVNHSWHGNKKDRLYDERWKLLVEHKFDPLTDLKRDTTGLWQLNDDQTDRFIELRDGLRRYGRVRNEDSNIGTIVP